MIYEDNETTERLQGLQKHDYGIGKQLSALGNNFPKHHNLPPYNTNVEKGHLGIVPIVPHIALLPVYGQQGYGGELPLSQQPKLDVPLPYAYDTEG